MAVSRWSPDGSQFGTGNLYGFTTMGEIIGVYYNKQKLSDLGLEIPTTFLSSRATCRSRRARASPRSSSATTTRSPASTNTR